MYAAADPVHSLGERLIDIIQPGGKVLIPVDNPKRAHLEDGAGEHVAHVIVNLPGDAVALIERGEPHLIIPPVRQLAVALLHGEGVLPRGIGQIVIPHAELVRLMTAPAQIARERAQQSNIQAEDHFPRQHAPDQECCRTGGPHPPGHLVPGSEQIVDCQRNTDGEGGHNQRKDEIGTRHGPADPATENAAQARTGRRHEHHRGWQRGTVQCGKRRDAQGKQNPLIDEFAHGDPPFMRTILS